MRTDQKAIDPPHSDILYTHAMSDAQHRTALWPHHLQGSATNGSSATRTVNTHH